MERKFFKPEFVSARPDSDSRHLTPWHLSYVRIADKEREMLSPKYRLTINK